MMGERECEIMIVRSKYQKGREMMWAPCNYLSLDADDFFFQT